MMVPTCDELLEPLFLALHELGGSASNDELEGKVAELMELSDNQLSELHSGNRTKFSYRLAWARTYLKLFGVITNSSRAVWVLTPAGQKLQSVSKKAVTKFVKGLRESPPTDEGHDQTTQLAEARWEDHALEVVRLISPDAFERLFQRLLRESGFTSVEVTGKAGDGGIDGKGVVRLGGLLSFHVIFQCKRYQGSISPSVVRDFRGAMVGRADKGLLITTGSFTREARREAKRDGAPPIDLIDGEELVAKLKELRLGIGVKTQVVEKVVIEESFFGEI